MQFPPILAAPLEVVPLALVQHTTNLLFRRLLSSHAGLFDRLGQYRAKRFAFIPSDVPLIFLVNPAKPSIGVYRKPLVGEVDAKVEGPLFLLLALLEGRCDADALFFSRNLIVAGDMEAMLAMRNALDDAVIDLAKDLSPLAGPFASFADRCLVYIRRKALAEETSSWS